MEMDVTKTIRIGDGHPLLVIAGPCQIESYDHCMKLATHLQKTCAALGLSFIFKSSYDKANRTSHTGERGVGIDEGLKILSRVRSGLGVPVLTDVHSPDEATTAGEVVDVLQTPAFLCRQTDLLLAAGETGRPVHIKKGQFLAPEDMRFAAEKVISVGNKRVMLCERGSCFGYRDLVVDLRGLLVMRSLGFPVIFDATHSTQSVGSPVGVSGGHREYIEPLAVAAAATGIDGIFVECHENPEKAPSDAASMLPLQRIEPLLRKVVAVREAAMAK